MKDLMRGPVDVLSSEVIKFSQIVHMNPRNAPFSPSVNLENITLNVKQE